MNMETPAGKLDPRVRRFVTPKRIVWQNQGADAPQNATMLLKEDDGQALLSLDRPCVLENTGDGAPGLLLDFGVELNGGVQIVTCRSGDAMPVTVRVRFGESASEAMGITNNDHAMHDQVVRLPIMGNHEVGSTGFRFVRIDLVQENARIEIKSIRAVFLYRELEYHGSFACSDERLSRIWAVGARTVHLCMQDFLWDGIKRDRLVWIGDMHPETAVIASLFGAHPIVPASLDMVRDTTPLPQWMNGISSYSIWWVLIHEYWYAYQGDLDYLRRQRTYLLGVLDLLQSRIGPDGAEALDGMRFLDWPSQANPSAVHAGLQSLMVLAMDAGARLCEVLGESDAALRCADAAARLRRHVPQAGMSKQANALLALSGLADAAETNRRVLANEPLSKLSTFYGYYVLQARARAGDYDGCLEVIRKYWGAMLDLGATSFWEDFSLDWTAGAAGIEDLVPPGMKDIHGDFGDYCYKGFRHSLCHGWAAGPTAWLSEHVLGVRPTQPGFAEVAIRPHLGGLEWAEGTFPTPRGLICVSHKRRGDGTIDSRIDAPAGVKVVR
ncbi:MAG: alpha-L-rhamnosidase C-terminal domain-containing protein [Phycisphaerae bacterium]|jgi:hypothetical protein